MNSIDRVLSSRNLAFIAVDVLNIPNQDIAAKLQITTGYVSMLKHRPIAKGRILSGLRLIVEDELDRLSLSTMSTVLEPLIDHIQEVIDETAQP